MRVGAACLDRDQEEAAGGRHQEHHNALRLRDLLCRRGMPWKSPVVMAS